VLLFSGQIEDNGKNLRPQQSVQGEDQGLAKFTRLSSGGQCFRCLEFVGHILLSPSDLVYPKKLGGFVKYFTGGLVWIGCDGLSGACERSGAILCDIDPNIYPAQRFNDANLAFNKSIPRRPLLLQKFLINWKIFFQRIQFVEVHFPPI
jgi:hypothetical protein